MHEIWPVIGLSLYVALIAVTISAVIGVPLGTWLGLTEFRGKRWVVTLVHTGMAVPPVVVGLLLYLLLSRSGPLAAWGWLFTPKAMILAQVILDLPFVIGITQSAVAAAPFELYQQIRSLGATNGQARWLMLREARGGVVLALATALGRSMSEVGAVWMVGGNIQGHTRVLTTAIVLETSKGQFSVALILAAALMAIALALNIVIFRLHGRAAP